MDRELLLEKYLMDELNEEELLLFNNLVVTDQDFKDEVEIRSVLFADFKTDIKKDLIKNLSTAKLKQLSPKETMHEQQLPAKRLALFRRVLPIAAILLVGFLGLWFFQNNPQDRAPQVAMQLLNESPPPGIPVLMDTASKIDSDWDKGVDAYQKNEYQIAASFFEKSQAKTEQLHFYLGLSYLHQKTHLASKAIEQLQQVAGTNSKFSEEANWYISLAYLLNDNADSAKKYLIQIPPQSGYHKKAEEILEEISQ